jgi:hypothetical protein
VTDQFYFVTIAGIALSAAGFAGLVTALRGDGQHWSRTELWRLRNIVQSSLAIVVVSLLPVPIYRGVGGDEPLVVRIMSALLVLILGSRIPGVIAERREWPGLAREAGLIVGVQLLVQLINVYVASLALLMFGLLAWLIFPLQLFMRVIRDFRPPVQED